MIMAIVANVSRTRNHQSDLLSLVTAFIELFCLGCFYTSTTFTRIQVEFHLYDLQLWLAMQVMFM